MEIVKVEDLLNEMLPQVTALTDLSEDQKVALTNLVKEVTNKKTSSIYKGIDTDITTVTGKEKPGTVKTYEFLKQVLNEQKTALQGLETLRQEKEELEAKVKAGKVDEALKGKFEALEGQYNALLQKYETDTKNLKTEYDNNLSLYDTRIKKGLIWEQLNDEIKLVPDEVIPKAVKTKLLNDAVNTLLTEKDHEIKKTESGKEFIVFKDKESGIELTNPEKGLAPMTAGDFVRKMEFMSGVIDNGRKQEGAGTKGGRYVNHNGKIGINGAKTQPEAYQQIHEGLMSLGLSSGSKEYQEKMDAAWAENNVQSLPAR